MISRRRPVLIVGILLFVLLIVSAYIVWLKQNRATSVPSVMVSEVEFIDEVGIGDLSFDANALLIFTEKFGVSQQGIYDWSDIAQEAVNGDYTIVYPEKIIIKLVNDEQKFYKLRGPLSQGQDIVTLFSIGQDFDESNNVLGLKLYVNKELVSQLKGRKADLASELNIQTILGLYKMSAYGVEQNASQSNSSSTVTARDFIIDLIGNERPVFRIDTILGRLDTLLGEFQFVKPAYAQCVGTVICGTIVSILKCTYTGSAADCVSKSEGQICGEDAYGSGTCQYDQVCDFGDDVNLVCPDRTSYGTCEGASGSCPAPYDCTDPNYQSSCTWTGPIPTPTPTPEPPPPPTPTPTPVPACTAPSGLGGGASCDGSDGMIDITWTWTAVVGANTYRLQVDNDPAFGSLDVDVITGSTSYATNNLTPGTWYSRMRVETSGASCTSPSGWSTSASATNTCAACAAPLNTSPASACVTQTTFDITWYFNESPGANMYQFVVSTGSGANFFANVIYSSGWQASSFFSCSGGSCNLPMTGFTSGITYYNLVQARGLSCPVSSWSAEQSASENCFLACPAPVLSSSGSTCDTGDSLVDITWQWNDLGSTGATSYRLQVDVSSADWVGMAFNQVLTPGVNLT